MFSSSPIFKGSIPYLYLYNRFIAVWESWSGSRLTLSFRGLIDGATQYDFGGCWPPTLAQSLASQDGVMESSEFVEYVFASLLAIFTLKHVPEAKSWQRMHGLS